MSFYNLEIQNFVKSNDRFFDCVEQINNEIVKKKKFIPIYFINWNKFYEKSKQSYSSSKTIVEFYYQESKQIENFDSLVFSKLLKKDGLIDFEISPRSWSSHDQDHEIQTLFYYLFNIKNLDETFSEKEFNPQKLIVKLLQIFFIFYPNIFVKHLHHVRVYGRCDYFLYFFPQDPDENKLDYKIEQFLNKNCSTEMEKKFHLTRYLNFQMKIVKHICDWLKKDLNKIKIGLKPSLLAKWLPTENSFLDKKYKIVKTITNFMGISQREYRKIYISPLRKNLKITERLMCLNRWDEIDVKNLSKEQIHRYSVCLKKRNLI
jgi:hypothetical protein